MQTEQTIFNKVVKHLLTQNTRSRKHGLCAYRGSKKGLKCAIGILIPDKLYKSEMEGWSSTYVASAYLALKLDHINRTFLYHLQEIHDKSKVSMWPKKLRKAAATFDLKVPKILKDRLDALL